jgi:hypothetical protein
MSREVGGDAGEVRGAGRSPIAVASRPRTAIRVSRDSASAPSASALSVSATLPEVHLRGAGGGQANVGAMRSMPSSGSSVQRGRGIAPTYEHPRLSALLNVPSTDTRAIGRAPLARSGSSIAAPCVGLIAVTRARSARVHSRHVLHATLAREACMGASCCAPASAPWERAVPRRAAVQPVGGAGCIQDCLSAREACIQDGLSATTRCIQDGFFSAPNKDPLPVPFRVRGSAVPRRGYRCIQDSFVVAPASAPSERAVPRRAAQQPGEGCALQGAREACISSSPRTPCIQTTFPAPAGCITPGKETT